MNDTKTCSTCKETKPTDQFNRNANKKAQKSGFRSDCKVCQSEYNTAYRARKTKEERAEYRINYLKTETGKISWLQTKARRLGMDESEVEKVVAHFKDHNGLCDICGRTPDHSAYSALCIDHCHDTNVFRGLLCSQCNTMLGHAYDNVDTLLSAVEYLQRQA